MGIQRLHLRHPDGETRIAVGRGALSEVAGELRAWLENRLAFVVTTPRVWSLHGPRVEPSLASAAAWQVIELPEGEAAKSLAEAERLWSIMVTGGGKRDSRLVALGGGSICDLGGFTAGCFLRGIEHLQLPTTLLAQVDAAVGGKTGVNLPSAKNVVGLFRHPWSVVAETTFLSTLPRPEVAAGLLEVVKIAVVLDRSLFERLEAELDELLGGDPDALAPIVAVAVKTKVAVVEQDPMERDLRRLLNFGHTLGHALENRLGYRGLRHGEAVGYGMLFALRLAVRRGLPRDAADRIRRLIARFDLPALPAIDAEELLRVMTRDKKARQEGPVWVLPTRLGEGRSIHGVEAVEVRQELRQFLRSPQARP